MKWICFTGIDGVGKTTLRDYTHNLLRKNYKVKSIKIPYFDWIREMIKISGDGSPTKDPHTDMLIFSAGNRLEMYVINKLKSKYDILISQRCWLDNFPYREAQGLSFKKVYEYIQPQSFIKPDIIFFLKCDYKTAFSRIRYQKGDKYEKLDFMKKLELRFEKMISALKKNKYPIKLEKTKIIILDSTKNLGFLKKEIKDHIKGLGFKL